jgi:arylsulfatase
MRILLFVAIVLFPFASHSQTEKPNFIIIMADYLGYSDLGCYGSEIETPNLDRLATQGLRFTQFYNTGRCWPTRSAILTGYYPQQVNNDGARGAFPAWGHLLPHHLKQVGYRSYHSGKWHVPNVDEVIDGGGFDRSYRTNSHDNHFAADVHFLNDEKLPPAGEDEGYYSTTAITNYAIDFLQEHSSEHEDTPFFLYLAYISPHFPLQAPQQDIDKYMGRYLQGWEDLREARYNRQKALGFELGENSAYEYHVTAPWSWPEQWLADTIPGELRTARPWGQLTDEQQILHATKMAIHAAMVDRVDREVGRLLDQLREMGVDRNTLVLFLSDNGASAEQIVRGEGHHKDAPLGSAGSYLCLGPGFSTAANTPLRRHKFWTHEGGINTPLVAYWPQGIREQGGFRHNMGHVVDFLPTFLDLAGAEAIMRNNGHDAPPLPGRSLVPLFARDQQVHDELYFSHAGNQALRWGNWKAVISSDIDGRWQLYNLDEDRTEIRNLADDFYSFGDPEWKKAMQEKLEEMKTRWHELDALYQQQGKVGLPEKK